MPLDRQPYKNQNMKNPLQCHKYIFGKTISSFKQAKCCLVCPLQNFINNILNTIKVSSAYLPTNRDGPSTFTAEHIASLQNFMEIKVISIGVNLCYYDHNICFAPLSVLCSFFLTK